MRQERIRALLQAEVATFMMNLRQEREWSELIGVDEVLVTPDLKEARIWLSFTPSPLEGRAKVLWEQLRKTLPALKSWLAERLELRKVPAISLNFSHPEEEYRLNRILDELSGR